jgi:hypothetical protein
MLVASNRRRLTELQKLATSGPTRYGPRALCRRCEDRRDRATYVIPPDELDDYPEDAYEWSAAW